MLIVRPAGSADLASLMELAILSGRGFTSLPEDEATLLNRLSLSEASFAGTIAPREAWYTLMLEDSESGRIEGIAGVRAAVGVNRPHFSFRVMTLAQFSSAINMLIGTERQRFSETVMAELRGYFAPDGICPFWEGVASKFFRLPFDEADHMVMSTDGQFILDLAPRHPIYVELIDDAAQQAIGRVHVEGEAARAMLEQEGFRGSGLIDIFDGGPTYSVPRDSIRTIDRTETLPIDRGDTAEAPERLVSSGAIEGFRAIRAKVRIDNGKAILDAGAIDALRLKPDDMVRVRQ